jgi:primosomal protein N'
MNEHKDAALQPGDRIRVRFGRRLVDGVVTSVRGGQVHVELDIDGTDEPVSGLYDENQLAAV